MKQCSLQDAYKLFTEGLRPSCCMENASCLAPPTKASEQHVIERTNSAIYYLGQSWRSRTNQPKYLIHNYASASQFQFRNHGAEWTDSAHWYERNRALRTCQAHEQVKLMNTSNYKIHFKTMFQTNLGVMRRRTTACIRENCFGKTLFTYHPTSSMGAPCSLPTCCRRFLPHFFLTGVGVDS